MKKLLLANLLLFFTMYATAQDRNIRGRIMEENGQALTGATVYAKGTQNGTISNSEGYYQLNIQGNETVIVFSFIGFATQELTLVDGQNVFNIDLKEEASTLSEVVVAGFPSSLSKARRRLENIQTIPESIIGVNAEEIENAGISGIPDFVSVVPNASFTTSQNIGTNALTVRGVSQLRNGEAPVALIIDGVNAPNPNIIDQEMFDIEQIELVKGPQGALYGRNAIGGALNIITKKPTDEFSHSIKAGYGNGSTYKFVGTSSGPVVKEKVLYRIGGSYKSSDGLIENTFLNKNVDFYENYGLRGQLYFYLTDNFSADIITNYAKTDGGATYYTIGNPDGNYPTVSKAQSADDTDLDPVSDIFGETERTNFDGSLRLNLGLSFGTLTSTTAITDTGYDYSGDLDFTPMRELFQEQQLNAKAFSQELRLNSKSGEKLDWVLGGFYQKTERDLRTLGSLSSAGFFASLLLPPDLQTDLANEVLIPLIDADESNVNKTVAFFGQANIHISENTELSLGLRYDTDEREQTNLTDNSVRSEKFSEIQPKVNLSQKFSESLFGFVSYSRGYRSGGFNAPTIVNYPQLYDAETSNNFELGFKSNWINNRLIVNLSGFHTGFDQTQIYLVEINGGGQIIVNLGATRNIGGELDFKYRVSNSFDIFGGIGIVNPEITDRGNFTQQNLPDGSTADINDEGNFAPQVNLNNTFFALQYKKEINSNQLILRAEHEHRGELYWHPNNEDVQPSTEFLNFRTRYDIKGNSTWFVGVYVKNLLDEDYSGEYVAAEYSGAAFGDLRWPGQPRTFGLELGVKF